MTNSKFKIEMIHGDRGSATITIIERETGSVLFSKVYTPREFPQSKGEVEAELRSRGVGSEEYEVLLTEMAVESMRRREGDQAAEKYAELLRLEREIDQLILNTLRRIIL